MKALFRVDASLQIGQGHLIRCLTLAQYLQSSGWNSTFACLEHCYSLVKRTVGTTFSVISLTDSPSEQTGQLESLEPSGVDLLIVDSYSLSLKFEQACRPWARRILVIDDLADRPHDADILLDQTYRRSVQDYLNLVPKDCKILVGSKYAILRPMFRQARRSSLVRRDSARTGIDRILVSLGSTDSQNITELVLHGIRDSGLDCAIDVVLASGGKNIDKIIHEIKSFPNGHIYIDTPNMAQLMLKADLAIGAGGTTSWERCCLGLPTVAVTLADNQLLINQMLSADGAVNHLGWYEDLSASTLCDAILQINAKPERLLAMSNVARAICDGKGGSRLLVSLLED